MLIVYGTTADRIALRRDGKPVVTDVRTGAVVWSPKAEASTDRITFSSDLTTALISAEKRTAIRIATAAGERTLEVGVEPNVLALSRDGRWLGVVGRDAALLKDAIRVCDLTAGSCRAGGSSDAYQPSGVMAANGRRFVMYGGSTIHVFDIATGKTESIVRSNQVSRLAISADGDTLAGVDEVSDKDYSLGGKTFIRDLPSGEERTLPFDVPVAKIVFPNASASIRVLIEKGGFQNSPIIYTGVDAMPRDSSIKGALARLSNAKIGPQGQLTAR